MSARLRDATVEVMRLLACKDYRGLATLTHGDRLSAAQIRQAIQEFGRTVVEPPPAGYQQLRVVEVTGALPPRWSVTMPVWTAELGESDLEVQMTMIGARDGIQVRLDNILVP